MYCQECGKEAQAGEVICASCGGALTDAELDLPEVEAFQPDQQAGEATLELEDEGLGMPARPASAQPASGPRLEITVGNLTGIHPLNREVVSIGRADAAVGHRPDVDLSMDQAVSRRHAEIKRGADGYVVVDLGSTNGTIVNGQQIPRQKEVPLSDGDEIRLGENCKLTVRL